MTKNELIKANRELKKEVAKVKKAKTRSNVLLTGALLAATITLGAQNNSAATEEAAKDKSLLDANNELDSLRAENEALKAELESLKETEDICSCKYDEELNDKVVTADEVEDVLDAATESQYEFNHDYRYDYDYSYNYTEVELSTPEEEVSTPSYEIQESQESESKSEFNDSEVWENTSDEEKEEDSSIESEEENEESNDLEEENNELNAPTYDGMQNDLINLFEEGVKLEYTRYGGGGAIFQKFDITNPLQLMLGGNEGRFDFKWNAETHLNLDDVEIFGTEDNVTKILISSESVLKKSYAYFDLDHFKAAIGVSHQEASRIFHENEMEFASSIRIMRSEVLKNLLEHQFTVNSNLVDALQDAIAPLVGDFEVVIEIV